MKRLFLLFTLMLFVSGCEKEQESTSSITNELPQISINKTADSIQAYRPKINLKAWSFRDLPNWKKDNLLAALEGFKDSCRQILKEKNYYLSNSAIKIPTATYQIACQRLINSGISTEVEFKYYLESNFVPFLITADNSDKGRFTSYYEAAINASPVQTSIYRFPIYGRPSDLIVFNPHDFDPELPSKRLLGRIKDKTLVPYYTREEIEAQKIFAPVILWGDSNIDINIMQIQGSAVATLPDGQKVRVGYADNNGHPFKGIGTILLEKNYLEPGKADMISIKQWLKAHPDLAEKEMRENKRFIFHRISHAEGPIGAHGVALHAGRSLAVDPRYIPLGSLVWLETSGPDKEKIEKLVVAQDIGNAIKGPIRGDYFWGSGDDDILAKAGKMNSEGRYFVLIPQNKAKQ